MNRKQLIIMGLALGLPSSIIGLFFVLNTLVSNGFIDFNTMLILLVLMVVFTFFLMMNYARKKKN